METLEVVNAEYTTNHHLGFSGVLETSFVVDEENFGESRTFFCCG